MQVSYHDSVTNLQASWGNFLAPFDRPEWFALLEATAIGDPTYAVARDGDASLILPLLREGDHLRSLTNWYSFHWRPLIHGEDGGALLVPLLSDLKGRYSRLTLQPVPPEHDFASTLAKALKTANWKVFQTVCDTNHILNVEGRSFEEYHASLPGRVRTTLKRKSGKVQIDIIERFDAAMWADYESIYADSWKPDEGEPAMLRAFAEQEGSAGRIRLAIASQGEQAVAAQFWTVENGVAYIHKLAHRKEAQKLSAGSSLTAALMEHVIDRDGVSLVDFGTGDDPYKRDWMNAERSRLRIECFDAAKPSNWAAIGKRLVHNLAQGNAAS